MTNHKKRAKARKKAVKRLKFELRAKHEERIEVAALLKGMALAGQIFGAALRLAAASRALHPDALHRRRVERALEMGFPAVPMKRPGFAVGGHRPSVGVVDDLVDIVAMATDHSLHRHPVNWAVIREEGPEVFRREYQSEPAPAKPPVCGRCNDAGQVVDGNAIPSDWREQLKYKPCPECVDEGRVVVVPRGSGRCGMGCGCFNQCELKNPKASTLPAGARIFIRDEYK